MGFVAILFNPIVPVYLGRGTWTLIDPIIAALYLWLNSMGPASLWAGAHHPYGYYVLLRWVVCGIS
jgi:hypothetical protein